VATNIRDFAGVFATIIFRETHYRLDYSFKTKQFCEMDGKYTKRIALHQSYLEIRSVIAEHFVSMHKYVLVI